MHTSVCAPQEAILKEGLGSAPKPLARLASARMAKLGTDKEKEELDVARTGMADRVDAPRLAKVGEAPAE